MAKVKSTHLAQCPYCRKPITAARAEKISIRDTLGITTHGTSYSCPRCDATIGVSEFGYHELRRLESDIAGDRDLLVRLLRDLRETIVRSSSASSNGRKKKP